jgi:hypothetical protein
MAINSSKITTDHDAIKKWVEQRGGHPATVKRTRRGSEHAGMLRIDFPGYKGQGTLEEISWDDFFDKFDEMNLAFTYQDKTATGRVSRFNKLVSRESAQSKSVRRPGRPSAVSRTAARSEIRSQPSSRGRVSSRAASARALRSSSGRGPGRPPGSKNKPRAARSRASR